jgi:hypothetical protein
VPRILAYWQSYTLVYEHFEPGVANTAIAPTVNTQATLQAEHLLSAAFTEEVCYSVFVDLFCSFSFNYDQLGESGYRSFQFLFKKLRDSAAPADSKKVSLDALWRVCLTAGKASVAYQAMKDLLAVYVALQAGRLNEKGHATVDVELMVTDENDESFGDRMF